MKPVWLLSAYVTVALAAAPTGAQDPVAVDPDHHQVVLENDHVRVLRIHMGPGDRTPLHYHPASVVVFMKDVRNRVTGEGGAPNDTPRMRGELLLTNGGRHVVENIGRSESSVVLVELKEPPLDLWEGPPANPTPGLPCARSAGARLPFPGSARGPGVRRSPQ